MVYPPRALYIIQHRLVLAVARKPTRKRHHFHERRRLENFNHLSDPGFSGSVKSLWVADVIVFFIVTIEMSIET